MGLCQEVRTLPKTSLAARFWSGLEMNEEEQTVDLKRLFEELEDVVASCRMLFGKLNVESHLKVSLLSTETIELMSSMPAF